MTKPFGQLNQLPGIFLCLAGRFDHFEPVLGAALGVAEDPFLLNPGGRGQDHVCHFR
jgi:hypothetical protein